MRSRTGSIDAPTTSGERRVADRRGHVPRLNDERRIVDQRRRARTSNGDIDVATIGQGFSRLPEPVGASTRGSFPTGIAGWDLIVSTRRAAIDAARLAAATSRLIVQSRGLLVRHRDLGS